MIRRLTILSAAALLLGSCTTGEPGDPGDDPAESARVDEPSDGSGERADDAADEADEAPELPCRNDEVEAGLLELTGSATAEVAARVAERTHRCAPVVVVAVDDPWVASIAAAVAHAADAPLLLVDPEAPQDLAPELTRLETEELITVGLELAAFGLPGTELLVPPTGEEEVPTAEDDAMAAEDDETAAGADRLALALRVADHLGTDRFLAVGDTDVEARAAALTRLAPDVALLPLPEDLAPTVAALPSTARLQVLAVDRDAKETAEQLSGLGADEVRTIDLEDPWEPVLAGPGAVTWLVDPADGAAAAAAAVAAAGRSEALLPVDGEDLRSGRDRTGRLRRADLGDAVLVGRVTDEAEWQLATVLEGQPLPGGGFRLFEDERMVALYGSVETTVLGVLGEQGLDATVERARSVAEPYGADGARVLPAFEIITTIASATAQPTGDYSRRTPIEAIRPWVDRAAEEGIYVFLDLQPGRTDFLTQAIEYEELLREPHVGLALDPEWRLEPDQVHLQQIGSVAAAEVQEVADWLAELTREHRLPEKLLVLHQFRFSMLPDRDTILAPPELAVVVHMDGQGSLTAKYETYAAITGGVEDRWLWGWKNFYDEDSPTATPVQVLDLDPLPVLVTYQ